MRLDNQLNGVTENVLKTPKRALPTFSESLKGVVTENFSGGFAPRPPRSFVNGPPQTSMLDPPLLYTRCAALCLVVLLCSQFPSLTALQDLQL